MRSRKSANSSREVQGKPASGPPGRGPAPPLSAAAAVSFGKSIPFSQYAAPSSLAPFATHPSRTSGDASRALGLTAPALPVMPGSRQPIAPRTTSRWLPRPPTGTSAARSNTASKGAVACASPSGGVSAEHPSLIDGKTSAGNRVYAASGRATSPLPCLYGPPANGQGSKRPCPRPTSGRP